MDSARGMSSQLEDVAQEQVMPSIPEAGEPFPGQMLEIWAVPRQENHSTTPDMEVAMQRAAQRAAERAVAQAQDLVEEVMRQALPMLREDLRREFAEESALTIDKLKIEVKEIKSEVAGLAAMVKSLTGGTLTHPNTGTVESSDIEAMLALLCKDVQALQASKEESMSQSADLLRQIIALEEVVRQQVLPVERAFTFDGQQEVRAGFDEAHREFRTEIASSQQELRQLAEEQSRAQQAEHKKIQNMIEAMASSCDQQLVRVQLEYVTRKDFDRFKDQLHRQMSMPRDAAM